MNKTTSPSSLSERICLNAALSPVLDFIPMQVFLLFRHEGLRMGERALSPLQDSVELSLTSTHLDWPSWDRTTRLKPKLLHYCFFFFSFSLRGIFSEGESLH